MSDEYDPQATTARLHTLSAADAAALEHQSELRRQQAASYFRRELSLNMGLVALGILGALGVWKLWDLVRALHGVAP